MTHSDRSRRSSRFVRDTNRYSESTHPWGFSRTVALGYPQTGSPIKHVFGIAICYLRAVNNAGKHRKATYGLCRNAQPDNQQKLVKIHPETRKESHLRLREGANERAGRGPQTQTERLEYG